MRWLAVMSFFISVWLPAFLMIDIVIMHRISPGHQYFNLNGKSHLLITQISLLQLPAVTRPILDALNWTAVGSLRQCIYVFFSVIFSLSFSRESYIKWCGFISYRFQLVCIIWIIWSLGQTSCCLPVCHRDHKLRLNQFTACNLCQEPISTCDQRENRLTKWWVINMIYPYQCNQSDRVFLQ
jgi:hypothetical protein